MCRLVTVLVASVLSGLLVGGCAGDGADGTAAPAPSGTATASTPPVSTAPSGSAGTPTVAVPPALQFRATTVSGGQFDAASLAGRPVVIWFWAAWCPRCAAATGEVKAVHSAHAAKVHVVGVAGLGSGQQPMRDFVARHGIGTFPHLADDDGAVYRAFEVRAQDTYVLLDAAGKTVHKGPLSPQQLRDRVAALAG